MIVNRRIPLPILVPHGRLPPSRPVGQRLQARRPLKPRQLDADNIAMTTFLLGWFALSVPVTLVLGRVIARRPA
jgi:hypothetical protein